MVAWLLPLLLTREVLVVSKKFIIRVALLETALAMRSGGCSLYGQSRLTIGLFT